MTYLQRAKMILGGMRNKAAADITNAQVLRSARALAYRSDTINGVPMFDSLSDEDKLRFFVEYFLQWQVNAVAMMDTDEAAKANALAIKQAAALEFAAS